MASFTQGSTRVILQQQDLTTAQGNGTIGTIVLDSRRTRPLWFDGRFLAAKDLEREQDYFLQRQADLGQAGGFGVIHGLFVEQPPSTGQVSDAETIVIRAGNGITPAGELVMISSDLTIQLSDLTEEENLGLQFGISTMPQQPARTRTGLYVIALRPVEFTANPITSYPTSLQGSRTTHDGDIVEATAVSLVPYPNPINTSDPTQQQAMLARQIFVANNPGTLSESLLPLAVVSIQRGAINWIDPYLVRRDSGPQYSGVRFGLNDPATQQAYLLQYNAQLLSIAATRQSNGLAANFAATDYLQALPSAGPVPLDGISTSDFSQVFFPSQMDVRLSVVPRDELPALVVDSLSLPPIDLTLPADAYANLSVFVLIPVARNMLASLRATLPDTPLNPTLPQVIANRSPLQLLKLFQGNVSMTPTPPVANGAWAAAIGQQKYGFYVRRRSEAIYVDFTGVGLTSSQNPVALGGAVTFTAIVRPSSATGTIQFNDGTTPLGPPVALSGASASIKVPNSSVGALTAGPHPITAVYSGDGSNAGSTSATLNEIVSDTVVALSSSQNPSVLGQKVTFTATISPNTATGNVQFMDGATALGPPVSLTGASATMTWPSGTAAALAIGAHSIIAVYSGDASNAGGTSAPLAQTVTQAASSVTVASSLNPATVGQGVSFTATVSGSVPGISPTGTVQFKDLATVIGTATVSGGQAVLATSALTAGAHSIAAVYSGDANYLSSTSATLQQTISAVTSGVVVSSSPNPSIFGKPVSLTATVTPGTATGSVQFMDGNATLGAAVTLAGGKAQLSVSTLTVGSHQITAAYSGDSADTKSTSLATTQVVSPQPSTATLTSALNPAQVGQVVTFTATVAPNTATGSVQFMDGNTSLGSAPLASATATLKVSTLTIGSHAISATYGGDTNDASSTSNVLNQTITQAVSSASVTSSLSPSTVGQAVTFTAKVTPSSATGTVKFLDGATAIGTATLSAGSAAITVSTLALGSHSITAAYSGDANDASVTSPAITQQVIQATSGVVLTSSLDPSQFGAAVTFTATVTPGTATGTIQFAEGGTSLGAAVAVSGGKAQLPVNNLTVGAHAITAVYSGDPSNAGSTSNTLTQTVNQANSFITLSSSSPSAPFAQTVTFTATVSPGSATGSVTFKDGTTAIGSGAITAGKATLAVSNLAVGPHSITAVYSGDTNFLTSTSAALTQTITQIQTTTTVTSSAASVVIRTAVTFTATVLPNSASGTVQFNDSSTSLGTATISGGRASLNAPSLAVGTHSITASYSGDTNDAKSTSPVFVQTVTKAPSSLTLTSDPVTPTFGQGTVTVFVTVNPNTATGTVSLNEGATSLGAAVTLSKGTATFPLASLAAGTHVVTATYSGDAATLGSTGSITLNVSKAASTVTVTSARQAGTLAPSPDTIFTATVAPAGATGTVTLTASPDTPPLSSGPVQVSTAGTATWTVVVPVTLQTITAVYSGDTNFLTSTGSVRVGG